MDYSRQLRLHVCSPHTFLPSPSHCHARESLSPPSTLTQGEPSLTISQSHTRGAIPHHPPVSHKRSHYSSLTKASIPSHSPGLIPSTPSLEAVHQELLSLSSHSHLRQPPIHCCSLFRPSHKRIYLYLPSRPSADLPLPSLSHEHLATSYVYQLCV